MTTIMSAMLLVVFVLSILPFVSTTDKTAELRNAINMVQLLEQPEDPKYPAHSSFKTNFKNLIVSLQTAANLNTVYTHQQEEKNDEAQLTTSIRVPYLLTTPTQIPAPMHEERAIRIAPSNLYTSHVTAPPFPPPLCS